MISNMESQLKQQGAGDRVEGGARRGAQGPQGRRLSAAGHALQPDRRHAGRVQRADGPLQGPHRRVRRPDARLLRRDDRPARSGGHRGRRPNTPRKSRSPAGRPTCSSPNGTSCGPQALALKGCNGTDEDVLTYAMFPQVAPKFFAQRAEGPKNVGKKPPPPKPPASRRRGQAQPTARGRSSSRVTYEVKIGDKSHKVTVEPREHEHANEQAIRKKWPACREESEVDGGPDRDLRENARAAPAGRRPRPPGQAEGAGQAHRPRAHRRARRCRAASRSSACSPSTGRPTSAWPARKFPADGVVTGAASVDGRLVHLASQDFTVLGGSAGEVHSLKVADVMERSLQDRQPVRLHQRLGRGPRAGGHRLALRLRPGLLHQRHALRAPCRRSR